MEVIRDIFASLFIIAGLFFFSVSVIGLLRLPDIYTRVHATAKGDTLGIGLSLLGIMLYLGISFTSLKLLLIVVFVWITSPTSAHLIGKSAYRSRVKPACGKLHIEDLREKEDEA